MHYCLQLNKFNGKYSASQIRSIAFVWEFIAGNVRETRYDRFPRSFIHLFPLEACSLCIFRSKSRSSQFYQIDIVFAPDQLDQDVCKLTRSLLIPPSCSPTKRNTTTRAEGVGMTITCKLRYGMQICTVISDYATWNTRCSLARGSACKLAVRKVMIQIIQMPSETLGHF